MLIWGAHGSGKTHFLEELERTCFGKFLPVFGDLYGSKFKTEEKKQTLEEAYELGTYSVIMEGKRFIENILLDTLGEQAQEMNERGVHSVLVIPVSSVESSERRVNHRRSLRGNDKNFSYPEHRAEYECQERFERKLVALYQDNPRQWSNVDLRYFFVEQERDSWAPLIDFFKSEFDKLPAIQNSLEVFGGKDALSHFWNSRLDTLYLKGQNYLGFSLDESEYDSLRFSTESTKKFENLIRKPRTEKLKDPSPSNDENSKLESKSDDGPPSTGEALKPETKQERVMSETETETKEPQEEAKTETAKPDKKEKATKAKTLELTPSIPSSVSKTSISKVRRGLKKKGLDPEKVTDNILIVIVGAFAEHKIDPGSKSSDWVGRNALPLAESLISGETSMPEGDFPEVETKKAERKSKKKKEKSESKKDELTPSDDPEGSDGEDENPELDGSETTESEEEQEEGGESPDDSGEEEK